MESYRAQALDAWQAGADGISIFNQFDPHHAMWRELGDPAQLATKDKVYFANVTGNGSWHRPDEFLAEREHFREGPSLHPNDWRSMCGGRAGPVTMEPSARRGQRKELWGSAVRPSAYV